MSLSSLVERVSPRYRTFLQEIEERLLANGDDPLSNTEREYLARFHLWHQVTLSDMRHKILGTYHEPECEDHSKHS
jgi:hypothetical protein